MNYITDKFKKYHKLKYKAKQLQEELNDKNKGCLTHLLSIFNKFLLLHIYLLILYLDLLSY